MTFLGYSDYISRFFHGRKIQKISVNAGMSCPNRDGRIGVGGCIYCNNSSFTPAYCFEAASVTEQLLSGKKFFGKKYSNMQYIAYFQSFTNTYLGDIEKLEAIYREAAGVKDVVGIAVGTRPDCFDDKTVALLAELNRTLPVFVEFGVESMLDNTLRVINRGHTSADTISAITRAADAGLHVGVHLIASLPGEPKDEVLRSLEKLCALPIESVKIHQLQVLRNTALSDMIDRGEIAIEPFTLDEYLELCVKIVKTVPKHIAIERFLASAPPDMVIQPKWGLKNYQFTNLLNEKLKRL
jgi:radical SAM protein (TIGR01212 family)